MKSNGFGNGTRFQRLRQAKVQHLDGAVLLHLHVGRLQIAVDDALLMRGVEGLGVPGYLRKML